MSRKGLKIHEFHDILDWDSDVSDEETLENPYYLKRVLTCLRMTSRGLEVAARKHKVKIPSALRKLKRYVGESEDEEDIDDPTPSTPSKHPARKLAHTQLTSAPIPSTSATFHATENSSDSPLISSEDIRDDMSPVPVTNITFSANPVPAIRGFQPGVHIPQGVRQGSFRGVDCMSVAGMETQKKKRRYSEEYIKFGFTVIIKDGTEMPQCVICVKVLSPPAMKPSLLQRHLHGCHQELKGKDEDYFRRRETRLNRSKLDHSGSFHQSNKAALHASYVVALKIAQQKKPHSIGETLVMPCTVRIMLGEQSAEKLDTLPLSDNTVQRRISDMSTDIKDQVVSEVKTAPLGIFALQLDETTDVNNCAQLLVFTRYIKDDDFKEDFLFCHPLESSTTGSDIFGLLSSFFESEGLDWENLCGCTTDGAPAMLGSQSGFKVRVKAINSKVKHMHCMIHRQALAAKTLPTELKEVLDDMVKMVNFVKSSALNSRLFRLLRSDLDSTHETLLYYTGVRWLSRGNVVRRVFELKDELKLFFSCSDKKVTQMYLAKLNDPKWITYLAYIVDIFSCLNVLNKSLQGPGAVVTDAVDKLKSFQMKLELWETKVKKGNFDVFETLADRQDISDQMVTLIVDHLSSLQNEIK
ncbi:SCAN domain-containing protein 3-like [Macrobrachium rosenbergii]|uniref:SCAN domain-containing protein 3-like n=1 Tax=Macrobrachium rosenbergii TaxID=79674 RepID=UPI0034D73246